MDGVGKRDKLRQLLNRRGIIIAPAGADAIGAKLIEATGFEIAYMSGYATAGTLGYPDVGLLSLGEMVERASLLARSISLPLIADADNGYGNPINVIRTVREFEQAGVSGVQLEDQDSPKKCGSMSGKHIVDDQRMVEKIRAAVDARNDKNFIVIARTDAMAIYGLKEVVRRAVKYVEAGADLIMVVGPMTVEDVRILPKEIPAGLVHLNSESGTIPILHPSELEELGYKMVVFPLALTLRAAWAMMDTLRVIRAKGTTESLRDEMYIWSEFNELMGLSQIQDWESQYGVG